MVQQDVGISSEVVCQFLQILAGLLVLHVAAAHKHHWIDRDDILTRMAPGPIARLLDRMRGAR